MKNSHPIRRLKYRIGYYNRKKSKSFPKAFLLFAVCILSIFYILYRINSTIVPLSVNLAVTELENHISSECNRIIKDALSEQSVSDIITYNKSNTDSVLSASSDLYKLNSIKSTISDMITQSLSDKRSITSFIPAGAFVTDGIMSAYGFEIPVKNIISATSEVEFSDDFSSAGINQTIHRTLLCININAKVHTLISQTEKNIRIDIPVCDSIIVGNVPEVILDKTK